MTERIKQPNPIEMPTKGCRKLRQFSEADSQTYFDLHDKNRPHLWRGYEGGRDDTGDKYKTPEEMLDSIVNPKDLNKLRFGIWEDQTLVGTINLTPRDDNTAEVGYWVDHDHLRQGIAADALGAIVSFADQEGYEALVAEVLVGNTASRGTLEKSGFRIERTFERLKHGITERLWELRLPFPHNT